MNNVVQIHIDMFLSLRFMSIKYFHIYLIFMFVSAVERRKEKNMILFSNSTMTLPIPGTTGTAVGKRQVQRKEERETEK